MQRRMRNVAFNDCGSVNWQNFDSCLPHDACYAYTLCKATYCDDLELRPLWMRMEVGSLTEQRMWTRCLAFRE